MSSEETSGGAPPNYLGDAIGMRYLDTLTGAFNRHAFMQAVGIATLGGARGGMLAVIALDLDDFGEVNQACGPEVGDLVLAETAARISRVVRDGDVVCRWAGDEFTVLLHGLEREADLEAPIRRLADTVGRPIELPGGGEVSVSVSIGSAIHPLDANDAETLLRRMDLALAVARNSGGRQHRRFRPEWETLFADELTLQKALAGAIERDELRIHYQPQIDLRDGRAMGGEALMRWRRPGNGGVGPDRFIPIAERTGLIIELGEWAIGRVADDIASWSRDGLRTLPISINVSARQLVAGGFAERAIGLIDAAGVPHDRIWFELTETAIVSDPAATAMTLQALDTAGFTIALDDFGIGNSSLGVLQRFPIGVLKIDRSFVARITRDPRSGNLVRAVRALAHELGIKIIVEGVETEEQRAFLTTIECDFGQGFLFDPALPESEFRARWLAP